VQDYIGLMRSGWTGSEDLHVEHDLFPGGNAALGGLVAPKTKQALVISQRL
jgi:hypothetical protein